MQSYNCNCTSRNGANPSTHGFVVSPDITSALAFAGLSVLVKTSQFRGSFRL
jgi:aconitate hydratase